MMGPMTHGVSFAADADGRRSTTRAGRAIVADALRPVDPVGALGAEQETAWRSGYVLHLRRLVEAGVAGPEAWLAIADAGLDAVRRTLVVAADDGSEAPLDSLATAPSKRTLGTVEVLGEGAAQVELVVPYRGRELRGADLRAQLDAWVARGVMEPSAATAVGLVVDHPEWLRLEGRTVAVLGAGAEMGPLAALLRWGATVAAVDLPRAALWERVQRTARAGAGRLLVPFDASASEDGSFGADLLAEVPEVSDWLAALDGRLVLGNYLYADGGTHVRVAAAADALATRLVAARPDTALAFLATPTDAFVVPREAVEHVHPRLPRALRRGQAGRPTAALGHPRPTAAPGLPARRRPRHQRRDRAGAGPQLRAGQAHPALAGRRRPPRRHSWCPSTSRRPPGPARS